MSDRREAIAEVLGAHTQGRARYGDYAQAGALIGKWGYRCPCGEFFKGEVAHAAHLADALLGSDVLAQIRAEARAEALREFAGKWARWIAADAPQVRGGAAHRALAEADRIAQGSA